jgi:hypothetical protein
MRPLGVTSNILYVTVTRDVIRLRFEHLPTSQDLSFKLGLWL